MSKARNISDLFSASTDVSTDAEVTAAIATHASNTTNRHYKVGNTASRPGSPNVGDIYTNTETGFIEMYESTGWSQVGAISSAPTSVTATDQPSGRAYNNGQASVAFTPGTVAGKTYTVTSSPGSYTATGSSSPLTVTGLQSSTQYTYTVTATNNYGTSSASAASSGVTATTVPQAPTIGTATAGDTTATLAFTAGATGGSAITNYKWSTDGTTYTAFSPAQTSSPLSFTGLTNGQSYAWYLKAVNANGDSTASSISNSITPISTSFESIATVAVGAGGSNTITFSSIPSTYTHLQLRCFVQENYNASDSNGMVIRFNSDSGSNYSWHKLQGDGSTASASAGATKTFAYCGEIPRYASGVFGAAIIDILDYKDTNKYKTVRSLAGFNSNSTTASTQNMLLVSGSWRNTNAITDITLASDDNTLDFKQYSHVALYGIKGA